MYEIIYNSICKNSYNPENIMQNDLLKKIETLIPNMTSAQKKVADLILSDSFGAAFSTIDKLAHASGVSTASVIRLANAVGYNTFSEFQEDLKECMRTAAAPVHRLAMNTQADYVPEGIASDVFRQGIENLNMTFQNLTDELFKDIASRLDQAGKIFITGARTSESTAKYLTFNLNRIFQNTVYVGEALSDQFDLIKKADASSVVIVISNSRYHKALCETAARCREKGSSVIGITDSYDSPLAAKSDIQLIGKCWSVDFHNSILSQIMIADVLIKACSEVNPQRVKANLEYDEQFFRQGSYYMR